MKSYKSSNGTFHRNRKSNPKIYMEPQKTINGQSNMKKFNKTLLGVLLVLVLAFAGFLGWLTMTEYSPDPIEELDPLTNQANTALSLGATVDLLSWNIGYAGLGAEEDFLLDGGQTVRPGEQTVVRRYLKGIEETVQAGNYDIVLLQEVDTDSDRTYNIDEAQRLASGTSARTPGS